VIITRTPFRVSFAGGGSDLSAFYVKNGHGAVVSAAIRKYMYISIHPYFHDKIRIKYSRTEDVEDIGEIKHPIVRECLKKVKIDKGVEIASFADVPAGTGLGSSSAFTVGLLHALYAYKGKKITTEKLAREACEIEIDILKEPIGKQDQYAAAYGNVNFFKFNRDETVDILPIPLTKSLERKLEQNLCLYYIGGARDARVVLSEQKNNMNFEHKFNILKKILILTEEFRHILRKEDMAKIGDALHKEWLYKKELSSKISDDGIDRFYEDSMKYGALGGKLLGAGGGGFFLLCSENHKKIRERSNCKILPFEIDKEGTKIIFHE